MMIGLLIYVPFLLIAVADYLLFGVVSDDDEPEFWKKRTRKVQDSELAARREDAGYGAG